MRRYLEYMTAAERASAASAGQSGLLARGSAAPSQAAPEAPLPEWLVREIAYALDESSGSDFSWDSARPSDSYTAVLNSPIAARSFRMPRTSRPAAAAAKVLSERVFSDGARPIAGSDRFRLIVISGTLEVLWGFADDTIHKDMVLYAMLTGRLPVERALGDYRWADGSALDKFAAFEYERHGRVKLVYVAESYMDIDEIQRRISSDDAYMSVINRIGKLSGDWIE